MPIRLSNGGKPLSSDIDDRRADTGTLEEQRAKRIARNDRDISRMSASLSTGSGSRNEYMKNLASENLKRQGEAHRAVADAQMSIQAEHDAARSARRSKTKKEYGGSL